MQVRWMLSGMVCVLSVLTAGCSGGGSGGGSITTGTAEGTVAVLIADGPADEYESIFLRIQKVTLFPEGPGDPAVLFSDPVGIEVDLLALRDEDFLLTIATRVPARRYAQLRLEVDDIRAVGGKCENLEIKLPSGRVTLKPREPFAVVSGGLVSLRLDIDANKSIHLHTAGNSDRCIFRPVVRVLAEAGAPSERCFQCVEGTILDVVTDSGVTTGFTLDLGGDQGEADVVLTSESVFFDDQGLPTEVSILEPGLPVTLRARLNDQGKLVALVVAVGATLSIEGTVTEVEDPTRFVMLPDFGGGFVGSLNVEVFSESLISVDCAVAEVDVIQPDTRVRVVGKVSIVDSVVRAAAIAIEAPRVVGQLLAVEPVADGTEAVVLVEGETVPIRLLVPTAVPFLLERDGEIPLEIIDTVLGCGSLSVILELDPVQPEEVISAEIASVDFGGTVAEVDAIERQLTVGISTVAVLPDASILDLENGQVEIPISEIQPGDEVRLLGLVACPGDRVDFYASVVLVGMEDDENGDDDD